MYHLTFSIALFYPYYYFSSGHGYFDFYQQKFTLNCLKKKRFTKIYYLTQAQFSLMCELTQERGSHWIPRQPLQSLLPVSELHGFLCLHLTPCYFCLCYVSLPPLAHISSHKQRLSDSYSISMVTSREEIRWSWCRVKCPFQAIVTQPKTWPLILQRRGLRGGAVLREWEPSLLS